MPTASSHEVTRLLQAWSDGDETALSELVPLVYAELHRLARHYLRGERHGHVLQTTALINEAYLKLVDSRRTPWQNRSHFFGISARLMRRILVDFARERNSQKRGGGAEQVSLTAGLAVIQAPEEDTVALDQALTALAKVDERKSRVVELRFFGGLNEKETAAALGVSEETVRRDWRLAKAWLLRWLSEGSDHAR
ncbi:MAG: sigma-70 family RNA polymerase sigma factor [Acidobacteria bacterium]|nr:MAG: sigma-70 family RNA polymerase sigma factor [Acidobacteriota bacterium]